MGSQRTRANPRLQRPIKSAASRSKNIQVPPHSVQRNSRPSETLPNYPRQLPRPVKRRPTILRASKSTIRRVMPVLDLIVIGFASFVAIVDIGIVALLTAHRH